MSKKPAECFRTNVRRVIRAKGMTITELAERCDSHRSAISRVLSGEDQVTLERAGRIASALELELCELVSDKMEILQKSA